MSRKRKGRKIYTYRARNHRVFSPYHPMLSAFGAVLLLCLVVFLGFVGYYAIGPILLRTQKEEQSPTLPPDPYFTTAVTTVLQAAEATTTLLTETTESTEVTTTENPREGVTLAYLASAEQSANLNVISNTAKELAAKGYSAVVLPLKEEGGVLRYASAVEAAGVCGAVSEEALSLQTIQNTVAKEGLLCYGSMDTLRDQLYPAAFQDGAFAVKDSGERWLDQAEEDGGRPWISPFSEISQQYLADIAAEITGAGIPKLFLTGVEYPPFQENDLKLIGEQVSDAALRAEGLAAVLKKITEAAPEACTVTDLYALLNHEEPYLVFQQLENAAFCVRLDYNKFNAPFFYDNQRYDLSHLSVSDRTAKLLQIADDLMGDRKFYPCLVQEGLTPEDWEKALDAACAAGYETILVSEKR